MPADDRRRRILPISSLALAVAALGLLGCGDSDRGSGGTTRMTPSSESPEPPQGGDVAAWIAVRATRADGRPAEGATAYAVRVGRSSRTRMPVPDWPQAEVDTTGAARIPVPTAGSYDVGVVFPAREEPRVLVKDVHAVAGTTTSVEAKLPDLAPVEVEIEGVDRLSVRIYAEEQGAPRSNASYVPARDERNDARWSFAGTSAAIRLPAGVPHALFLEVAGEQGRRWLGDGWLADPAVVRAPARVVFRRDPSPEREIAVPLRFQVVGVVSPSLRRSELRTRYAEGTPNEMSNDGYVEWENGKPKEGSVTILPARTPQKFAWQGDGVISGESVLPGSAEVKDEIPPIEITIRADEIPSIEGVEIVGRPPRTDSAYLHAVDPSDVDARPVGFYIDHEDRFDELRPGWSAVLEWGAWSACRPVTVPRRGKVKVSLVPGGYLQATSSRVPTPGLGTLTIRRADGAWLGTREADDIARDACDGETAVVIRPGMILGPLPEGDVELVVSLGGEERTRIVGHVKVHAITPFALRW